MCRPDASQIIAARAARAEQLEQTLRAGGRLVTYTLIRRQHAGLYLAAVPPKGMDSYMMERTGRWLPDVPVSPKALAEYVGCQARGAWDEGSRTEAISLPAPQPELYARTCSGAGVWGPGGAWGGSSAPRSCWPGRRSAPQKLRRRLAGLPHVGEEPLLLERQPLLGGRAEGNDPQQHVGLVVHPIALGQRARTVQREYDRTMAKREFLLHAHKALQAACRASAWSAPCIRWLA